MPARVINLVRWSTRSGPGRSRTASTWVGRNNGSRTIVCAVEAGRTTIDARAAITDEGDHAQGRGSSGLLRERVVVQSARSTSGNLDRSWTPSS